MDYMYGFMTLTHHIRTYTSLPSHWLSLTKSKKRHSLEVESLGAGVPLLPLDSHVTIYLPGPWASCLTSLHLSYLINRRRMTTAALLSKAWYKD